MAEVELVGVQLTATLAQVVEVAGNQPQSATVLTMGETGRRKA